MPNMFQLKCPCMSARVPAGPLMRQTHLHIFTWVCVKTPGPRWICGSLLFNRVLNGGIEREVLNGGITGGIERRAFPKQTSHVTKGSKLTFVRVRVPVCVCGVCVCVCVGGAGACVCDKMAPTSEA